MRDSMHAGDREQLTDPNEAEDMPVQKSASTNAPCTKPTLAATQKAVPSSQSTEPQKMHPNTIIKEPAPRENLTSTTIPLSASVQSRIGAQMQSFYNDLLKEETPERFLKLLEELDRKSSS